MAIDQNEEATNGDGEAAAMSASRAAREREIFDLAMETPRAQWLELVSSEAAGDEELRVRVMALLEKCSAETPDIFDGIARETAEQLSDLGWIGKYKLLEEIGKGGYGVVYRAQFHERETYKQEVAIKVLRAGPGSRGIIERFKQEMQLLAVMKHESIVKINFGGITDRECALGQGLPYFVMPLIREARWLTDFCDRERLSIRDRLGLFLRVCEAVQHAHVRLVIHRDLKPSNILVECVEGKAQVRIIDFGVAKSIDDSHTFDKLPSLAGDIIGTPEYMSPEQAARSHVDFRADVYSLGAVLYELLVGSPPLESRDARLPDGGTNREAVRTLPRPEPGKRLAAYSEVSAKPGVLPATEIESKPVSPLPGVSSPLPDVERALTPDAVSRARRTNPQELARQVSGQLEAIAMKAISLNLDERYESVKELAEDVRRLLDNRPVRAQPATRWLRARKWVRRNRVACAVGGCAVAGAVMVATAWVYAASERVDAQRAILAAHNIIDMTAAEPWKRNELGFSSDARQAERLHELVTKYSSVARGYPETEAEFEFVVGKAFVDAGVPEESIPHMRRARELWRDGRFRNVSKYVEVSRWLGDSLARQDTTVKEAIGVLTEVVDLMASRPRTTQEEKVGFLDAGLQLAMSYKRDKQWEEADRRYQQIHQERSNLFGMGDPETIRVRLNMALNRADRGFKKKDVEDQNWALDEFRSVAADFRRVRGPYFFWTIVAEAEMAVTASRMDRNVEAMAAFRSVEDRLALLGDQSFRRGEALARFGQLLLKRTNVQRDPWKAAEVLCLALDIYVSEDSRRSQPSTLIVRKWLSGCLEEVGDQDGAIRVLVDGYNDAEHAGVHGPALTDQAKLIADMYAKSGNATEEASWRLRSSQ